MKIKPILTERTLKLAKDGWYTFSVSSGFSKFDIKNAINELFGVHVRKVRTAKSKARVRKDYKGRFKKVKAFKKAAVKLSEKEKIDLFEEGGKKGK
ncbi:50S ribosomal protein L23 [Candidatus Woesebacteria bacterium]|nr:50S ribosomal protein L23 [Candidatus Woesebacteria bacterium]